MLTGDGEEEQDYAQLPKTETEENALQRIPPEELAKLRHIVVTRYNLRLNFARADAKAVRSDESWLPRRKVLFDTYCLPTMRAQVNRDFDWFILFDSETPDSYMDYFDDVAIAIRAKSMTDGHDQIARRYDSKPVPTITTRLDNDDGLSKYYIAFCQDVVRTLMRCSSVYSAGLMEYPSVLNFRTGYEIDTESGDVYRRDYPSSSFFSLMEGVVGADKVRFASRQHHAHVSRDFGVTNVSTRDPMWIMSIHGDNIGNTVKGVAVPREEASILDTFGIEACNVDVKE